MNSLRIGLLGGSFNPAHDGHRHISLYALRRLRLDMIWWLVSPQNPLKPEAGMAAFGERIAGAQDVARHPRIRVSDIETRLGTQYTVDTVRALKRRFRRHRFVWIMGADNLVQLPKWRQWTAIFDLVPVAVFARSPYSGTALSGPAARRYAHKRLPDRAASRLASTPAPAWVFLHTPLHPASATRIRAARQSVDGDTAM